MPFPVDPLDGSLHPKDALVFDQLRKPLTLLAALFVGGFLSLASGCDVDVDSDPDADPVDVDADPD
jgi:hypothetical protein